jgi:hypothetical protein
LLLKEIMTDCKSFHSAQAVSIERNKMKDSWELHVNWAPLYAEIECLERIVAKHGLEMVTTNERTVFRSASKA